MAFDDVQPLREILQRALTRYLTARPGGFQLGDDGRLHEEVDARILGFGGARSLYRNRKPACRSLDGLRPIHDQKLICADCRALLDIPRAIAVDPTWRKRERAFREQYTSTDWRSPDEYRTAPHE